MKKKRNKIREKEHSARVSGNGGNPLSYRYYLFLYLIRQFNGERTLSGIFHLLKGKKSAQTIQDSFLFHAEPFFHSIDSMDRRIFNRLTEESRQKEWISPKEGSQDKYVLTSDGHKVLTRLEKTCSFPGGLLFTETVNSETDFWLKLQLAVQTLSELTHRQSAFLPVTRQGAVTESVRRFLKNSALDRCMLAKRVFEELHGFLSGIPKDEADMLVGQMTGFGMAGLTINQLSDCLRRDAFECQLLFKSALRRLLHRMSESPGYFPNLCRLQDARRGTLSATAGQTFRYLKEGMPVKMIAAKRKLSSGTIEDHIVEIALKVPGFSTARYLPEPVNRLIHEAISLTKTRQLKPIKELLHDRASYFQIRLALAQDAAKWGEDAGGKGKTRTNEK